MTSSRWLSAAAIAIFAIGCGTQDSTTGSGGDNTIVVPPGHHQPPPPPPPPMCRMLGAPGSIVSAQRITGGQIVALDSAGNLFYTANQGIVKQTPAGTVVYSFPFGSVLAVDAAGFAYVAGSFTQPIDLGQGRMTPMGNIDVFVAKLSPRGELVFAVQLGLCGDGVQSIAVAADGRIAVSGDAMGTAILDAHGKLLDQLYYAGQLAFDSHGNLFVAGSFVGSLELDSGHVLQAANALDQDGFLAEVDCNAKLVSSVQFGDAMLPVPAPDHPITTPRPQFLAGIAIDAHDDVALLGAFQDEMSLFGNTVVLPSALPSGVGLGTFVVKLNGMDMDRPMFAEVISRHYRYNPTGSIALDASGNVLVSTNETSEAFFPFALPQLFSLDGATGNVRWLLEQANPRGYGLGVAADACGNAWWADTEHENPLELLQPTLRLVAR